MADSLNTNLCRVKGTLDHKVPYNVYLCFSIIFFNENG